MRLPRGKLELLPEKVNAGQIEKQRNLYENIKNTNTIFFSGRKSVINVIPHVNAHHELASRLNSAYNWSKR